MSSRDALDPRAVLGVPADADAAAIRAAYLDLVRRHSPDLDPRRFEEIRAAYESLSDPVAAATAALLIDALEPLSRVVAGRPRRTHVGARRWLEVVKGK